MQLSHLVLVLVTCYVTGSLADEDETERPEDQGYRMAGLFGFNGGQPFYLEKDPLTGAVDFNTRTSPVKRNEDNVDTDEYFYEDEEDTGDGIDRKDGGVGRPNHFNPYANDVNARIVNHKYDTNNKLPLISSSYANTKIQGTGAENGKYNHRPYSTSSTQSPSYYTIRPPSPTYTNPPATSTLSTTTPAEDYYEDEYETESGSEFKLSDLFGYGQASESGQLDQSPENSNHTRPAVTNNNTERPTENVHLITSAEDITQSNQKHVVQTNDQYTQVNQEYEDSVQDPQVTKGNYNHTVTVNETNHTGAVNQQQQQFIRPTELGEKNVSTTNPLTVSPSTPSTTPFVGIIYSESGKPTIATSLPLGTHFQYTTLRPTTLDQHSQQYLKNDNRDSSSKLSAQPSEGTSKPVNVATSAQFSSSVLNSPYGSYAEEPFRPIFGPGDVATKEAEVLRPQQQPLVAPAPVKNTNTLTVVGQESSLSPVRQQLPSKIPEETPTRWNYPYRDGNSQYFQLPKEQHQQPPRFPGVQPPNMNTKPVLFEQNTQDPKVSSHVSLATSDSSTDTGKLTINLDSATQKPSLSQQNVGWYNKNYEKHVNAGLQIGSGDNTVEVSKITVQSGIQFSPENDKTIQQQQPNDPEELGTSRVPSVPDQRRPPFLALPPPTPTKQNTLTYAVQEPAQDLRPPAEPEISRVGSQNFPRPHWESRPSGSQTFISQQLPPVPQSARPKQDVAPAYFGQMPGPRPRPVAPSPTMLQGTKMQMKNNPNQDPRLPNILPQFRPNAKISHGHSDADGRIQTDSYFGQLPRQPFFERRPQAELTEHLQPPPPSNYRRVNRNETPAASKDNFDAEEGFQYPPAPPQKPLVHRRTGPHSNSQSPVATLQMMQHQQLLAGNKHHVGRPLAARDDFPDKYDDEDLLNPPYHVTYPVRSGVAAESSEKRPVFVVYPVNSASSTSDSATTDDSAIVMGTRGPNWPVPPSDLGSNGQAIPETDPLVENPLSLPFIGHKDQKPLLQLPSDRLDMPVLKEDNHATVAKPIKTDFPYPLEPPTLVADRTYSALGNETSSNSTFSRSDVNRHKETFSLLDELPAEVHNSNIDTDHEDDIDTEINIIPYLQDYMPFATKKPVQTTTTSNPNNPLKPWAPSPTHDPHRSPSPISVTLKTVQPTKATTEHPKSPSEKIAGSEFTVSAVMHTHQSNHRPAVEESTSPPPQLNFQAPFLASENIAANKGWNVVSSVSPDNVPDEKPQVSKDTETSETSNFDFENFRPQLFGGFKPIYSFPPKDVDERSKFTTEREEKMIWSTP